MENILSEINIELYSTFYINLQLQMGMDMKHASLICVEVLISTTGKHHDIRLSLRP